MQFGLFPAISVVASLSGLVLQSSANAESKIDFNRDIRPILSDNCYYCHGPDVENNKADLRLDIREVAIAAEAFVPGNLEDSELIYRILTKDKEDLMPPPKSHKSLTKREIDLLKRWIKEGAEYDSHWSYKRVERPDGHSIDDIVAKGLKKHDLKLSKQAEQRTLLRRLHLDVIGLPPTPEQSKKFLEKPENEGSYEALVDELLASPHYGENMAVYWLDAVRFADSIGYHSDSSRDASPFRDYVIHAFNTNKPYKEFVIEQLAGDLLPNATMAQRVASGYNRLNQISQEGGIQDEEYLKKYQAERVRTTSTTMLGSTLACAECHDHKFDPFTAKDFYAFAAFFSDILEKGAWNSNGSYQEPGFKKYFEKQDIVDLAKIGPTLSVPNRTFLEVTPEYEAELEARKIALESGTENSLKEFDSWIESKKKLHALGVPAMHDFPALDTSRRIDMSTEKADMQHALRFRFEVKQDPKANGAAKGFAVKLGFESGEVLLHWGQGLDQKAKNRLVVSKGRNHRVGGAWKSFEFDKKDLRKHQNDKLKFVELLSTQDKAKKPLYLFRNVRMETTRYSVPNGKLTATSKELLEKHLAGKDSAQDQLELRNAFHLAHAVSEDLRRLRDSYTIFNEYLNGARQVPATISAKRREIRILPRGNWMDRSGEVVQPATPEFMDFAVKTTDPSKPLTRLDLAQWIVHRDNPLAARAYVNRLWAQFFGTALSSAPEDLGLQGVYPAHPELLDFLAAEFMESGWDVKHVVKLILMSKTYRQSSQSTPELNELDPYNRLLARQSPRRLKAESIRDNALALSGLLVDRIGGRSVMPYQPDGYYQHLNFPRRKYKEDVGDNQYRRGLYSHWQRTFLHPMMIAFDAPGRDECAVDRPQSNTPLQALSLLNDPSFVEASMALARQVLKDTKLKDKHRIIDVFETVLSRQPNEKEKATIAKFLERERKRFLENPDAASNFLAQFQMSPPEGVTKPEWAAWASVSRAMLNLHETITRY